MDFLQLDVVQWIVGIITGALAIWKIVDWVKIGNFAASKIAPILNKVEAGMDGVALFVKSAGLEKLGGAIEEAADVVDELEDVATVLAEHTKNGKFTKEAALAALDEVGEVIVEGKDFWMKVVKKQHE